MSVEFDYAIDLLDNADFIILQCERLSNLQTEDRKHIVQNAFKRFTASVRVAFGEKRKHSLFNVFNFLATKSDSVKLLFTDCFYLFSLFLPLDIHTGETVLHIAKPLNLSDEAFCFINVLWPTTREILKFHDPFHYLASWHQHCVTALV